MAPQPLVRLICNRFKLSKMIAIVPCHSFDDRLKGHVASLWVLYGLCKRLRAGGFDEGQIPSAQSRESIERGLRWDRLVVARPSCLIERLNDMVRFREGLPEPKREGDFRIRQVTDDFARGPLPGTITSLETIGSKPLNDL